MKLILLIVTVLNFFYATYAVNGGERADVDDLKYVVSIHFKEKLPFYIRILNSPPYKICTGGIIHEKFILTTAHCFAKLGDANPVKGGHYFQYSKNNVMVYANNNNVYTPPEQVAVKSIGKKVYFKSEFFDTGEDDIAILELKDGLRLDTENKNVLQKLTFPPLIQGRGNKVGQYRSYSNAICLIAAFGLDKRPQHNDGSLKIIYTNIIYHSNVKKYLFGSAIRKNYGYPKQPVGSCQGDSGAPVVLLTKPPTIIGIVSKVNQDCDSRIGKSPEQYIRVTNYVGFIKHVTLSKPNSQLYKSFDI